MKGHIATGMGGAIKNFGMGGVTKETKRMTGRELQKLAVTVADKPGAALIFYSKAK